jgi:hypothetical protein
LKIEIIPASKRDSKTSYSPPSILIFIKSIDAILLSFIKFIIDFRTIFSEPSVSIKTDEASPLLLIESSLSSFDKPKGYAIILGIF